MNKMEEFFGIDEAETYFTFFNLAYDENVLEAKHTHIMRRFGKLLEKARHVPAASDEERLKHYRFALLCAYKEVETGAPSAADVWELEGRTLPCQSCKTTCMEERNETAQCR
jgi:nitrogenase-stabilizing/protective protein